METFAVDKSLYEYDEQDLEEFWDPEFNSPIHDPYSSEPDWTNLLDNQPVVLNDRMITDAVQSPRIQTEHSYSLSANDDMPGSPLGGMHDRYKLEDFGKDLDSDCFQVMPMSASGNGGGGVNGGSNVSNSHCCANSNDSRSSGDVHIKEEPLSAPCSPLSDDDDGSSCSPLPPFNSMSPYYVSSASSHHTSAQSHTLIKQPTIVLATTKFTKNRQTFPKVSVKVEQPHSGFGLPPTPPSSNSSDSEGSLSPIYSQQPSSPPSMLQCPLSSSSSSSSSSTSAFGCSASRKTRNTMGSPVPNFLSGSLSLSKGLNGSSLISCQAKGATGLLHLTEEEKRTLVAEGYPVPTRLPLTKSEEKSLKKIRRKIKNKISAQESRRKKKEYMDALEKKVENLAHENGEYKRRLDSLESNNKSLVSQLQKLQSMLGELPNKMSRTVCTQTSNSVMNVFSSSSSLLMKCPPILI